MAKYKTQKPSKPSAETGTKNQAKTTKTSIGPAKKARIGDKPLTAIANKQTKAQIIASIVQETGVAKRDVSVVLESLGNHARRHLIKRGSGEFVIPGLPVKLRRVKKPATKARRGRNPFTGAEMMIPARPAINSVRAAPLKALKQLVL